MPALVETFAHSESAAAPWWNRKLEGVSATSWEDFQKAAGLDWKVRKDPYLRRLNLPGHEGEVIPSKAAHAITRISDDQELGVVGPLYTPIQNEDVFKWFDPWIEEGLAKFETAGSLKDGKIVWALAKVQGLSGEVKHNHEVRRYVLLSNSHDGSTGILNGTVDTCVVCWNTMQMARAEGTLGSIRHTESAEERLKQAQKAMDTLLHDFQLDLANYKRLAESPIPQPELVGKYVLDTFGLLPKEGETLKLSTRSDNMVKQILKDTYEGIGTKGETWWDAYMGVTQYLTHEKGSSAEKRLVSNWFGDSQQKNKLALKKALAYAGILA